MVGRRDEIRDRRKMRLSDCRQRRENDVLSATLRYLPAEGNPPGISIEDDF
jgi:hypothetical protein